MRKTVHFDQARLASGDRRDWGEQPALDGTKVPAIDGSIVGGSPMLRAAISFTLRSTRPCLRLSRLPQ